MPQPNPEPRLNSQFGPIQWSGLGLLFLLVGLSAAGSLRSLAPGVLAERWAIGVLAAAAYLPSLYYAWALARSKSAPLLRSPWAPFALAAMVHLAVQLSGGIASDLFGAYALLMLALGAFAPMFIVLVIAAAVTGLEAAGGRNWALLLPLAGALFGRALSARSQAQPAPPAPETKSAAGAGLAEAPREALPASTFDPSTHLDKASTTLIDLAFNTHPAWNALVWLWHDGQGSYYCRQIRMRQGKPRPEFTVSDGDGMLGLSLKERKHLALPDLAASVALALPYYAEASLLPKALLSVPMYDEGRLVGLIAVDKAEAGEWDGDEMQTVTSLGIQIVTQDQQARFLSRLQAESHQLNQLYSVTKELGADLDRTKLLGRIEELCSRLLPFDSFYLALRDSDQADFSIATARGYTSAYLQDFKLNSSTVLGGWVLSSGEAVAFNAERADASIPPFLSAGLEAPAASFLLVPMMLSGRVSGLLKLDRIGGEGFSEQDREVALIFASQAALTLEHARLYTLHQLQATTDGLTGLYNRRYFQDRLAIELDKAAREGKPLSLALTDIDFFKKFNDVFGHQEGDAVLRKAATLIKESVRQDQDIVCRYGGEEFVIILPECDLVEAREVLDRIRQHCADTLVGGSGPEARAITFSVGLSSFPLGAREQRDLIHLADEALYKAKQTGRNKVCSFKDLL